MAAVRMTDLPTTGTDVLVVGAGPTGLMAGLVLTRRGVPVVVVDQKEGPTRESRALAVQARTMEIYDQLGLADQVLTGAYPALRMQIGTDPPLGGVSIADLQQGETRYPGIQIFEQSANEQLLSRSLAVAGTDVLWRHRLIDLIDDVGQTDGQVVALLDGPAGLVRVRTRWCIGADGARSAVRRELDIPFEGVTDDATFWVADLRGVRLPPVHDNHVPLRTLAWQVHAYGTEATRPDLPAWMEGPHHFPADQKGQLQKDRLYLIRPDGYIAASLPIHSGHVNDADLRAALAAHELRA